MRKKTIDTIPVLTEEIKNILTSFSRSRTLPASLMNRASIALMASEGLTNQEQLRSMAWIRYTICLYSYNRNVVTCKGIPGYESEI